MADKRKNDYELTIAFDDENTLVIMDSNVWLNLYTIHPLALEEIVEKISENKDKFWISNQVHREFYRNSKNKKDEVIEYYKNARLNCIKVLERAKDIVGQTFENFRRKQRTDGEFLKEVVLTDLQAVIQKFKSGYEELEKSYKKELAAICERDIVSELVDEVYENSKTKDFSIMEKAQICEEGEIRYKYKIAPGYTDEEKKSDFDGGDFYRKYGDLIIWKEILKKVENTNTNTLFVQDEKKKDWFSEKGGTRLAQVLYEEYAQATHENGTIEVCDFLAFLECYGKTIGLLEAKISDLIEKLKYENAILNYVDEHMNDILLKQISAYFGEINNIYEIFYDSQESVFGGTLEDVEDLYINFVNTPAGVMRVYDRTQNIFYLKASYSVSGSVYLTEYVNKNVKYVGNVDFSISGSVVIDLAVNFEDRTKSEEEGFDIVNEDFEFETVNIVGEDNYDIDFDFEED